MKGPDTLLAYEDNWETELGAWFPGETVIFRGLDVFKDLNHLDWVGMWFYSITGRFFSDKQVELFSRLWVVCTSYPEPRIWNNRVAALSATSRSTGMLALAAAIGVSEGKIYGGQANIGSVDFITRAKRAVVDEGQDLDTFLKKEIKRIRQIPFGYGRPIINGDERVPYALSLAEELGFADGPHVKLTLAVEEALNRLRYRAKINIGGLSAALWADQGISPKEYYYLAGVTYSAGMMACYVDAVEKPAGSFFPLRCDRIEYSGVAPRKW